MRVWFVEIGEPLPVQKDVRLHRVGNLSREFAAAGHDVTWWTSNFVHVEKTFVREGAATETVDGVQVRMLPGLGYQRNVSPRRFQHQADFAAKFAAEARKHPSPPDIILGPVPTIEGGYAAVQFGKERGIPVLTDIRDEWPDEFVRLAPSPARWIARLILSSYFKKMEFLCKNATGIIGISDRKLDYGLSFAARPRGATDGIFPIGYDPTPQDPTKVAAAKAWWKEKGVRDDAFVACFFGTIGKFFNMKTVINAARKLRGEMPIQVVLCGYGSDLDNYAKQAAGIPEVLFPGWVDAPKIAALMEMSSVGLAPYFSDASMSLPNKPFEYFSGSLPVVSSLKGELAGLLAEHRCGVTYDDADVEGLCAEIRGLKDPAIRREMGARGRKLLMDRFTVQSIAAGLIQHCEQVVRRGAAKS